MILLDTDIVIDVLRGHVGALAWLGSLGSQPIGLPGFVVMEVIQGCRNKAEQQAVTAALPAHALLWPDAAACNEALRVFSTYHLSHSLGLLDALIGQVAVAANLPLHTFNVKHYSVIPAIKLVSPYSK